MLLAKEVADGPDAICDGQDIYMEQVHTNFDLAWPSRSTEITLVEIGWDMAVGFFFPLCHFFIYFLTVPWMLTFLAAAKHKT